MTLPRLRQKPRKRRFIKDGQRVRSAKHLNWVRKHFCAVSDTQHMGGYEAHHVKTKGAGGGDEWAICLCAGHHREIHDIGRQSFAARHAVDLDVMAREFAEKSPDPRVRAAAKVYNDVLESELPEGPDKTFVIRNHRSNAMWANVAITRLPDGTPRT